MDMVNVALLAPPGILVEVGVYKGGTAYFLTQVAQHLRRSLWLFDTFSGMPESTEGVDTHPVGDFADCSVEAVQRLCPEAIIFQGMFPQTLPDWRLMPIIGFAHIDCDQYESIKQCIQRLGPHMASGGMMYFDDYSHLEGARKAIDEFAPQRIVLANGKALVIFR